MYNETNERSPMVQNPPHFPLSVILLLSFTPYIPLQSSSQYLDTNVGNDNHVMTFPSNKHFSMFNTGQEGLDSNTKICNELEALSTVIPTIYGNLFLWPQCSSMQLLPFTFCGILSLVKTFGGGAEGLSEFGLVIFLGGVSVRMCINRINVCYK
jgi:hypothetical protein